MYRWAWYQEKKLLDDKKIDPEDSSLQPYFIYSIIMSIVTVREVLYIACKLCEHSAHARAHTHWHKHACTYTPIFVGHRTSSDSGDEKENRAGHAAFPGGR